MTRRRWLAVLVVMVVFSALVLDAGARLINVDHSLEEANDLVERAAQSLTEGQLEVATRQLQRAENLVLDANERLRTSVGLGVARLMPVASTNLRSVEQSVELASIVVHGGLRILRASGPLESPDGTLEVSMSDGAIPVAAVTEAQQEIAELLTQLGPATIDDPSPLLLPPVRKARERVLVEVDRRRDQLSVLGQGLSLLREIAGTDGPSRYLIAVANTAEMRGSGGMILNYGVLEGRDGTIDLSEFGRIDELALAAPVSASVAPADYVARWSGFDPLQRWRQANLSGDFAVVAPVLEAMFTAATRLPVDGVIQIDPGGLAALLDGVGPVTVPEVGKVDGKNVVPLTLNQAYFRFPNVEQRSDVLGDVAHAAFDKLVKGDIPSLRTLAERLSQAVDGRHLLMSTAEGSTQPYLESFGAGGAYPKLDGPDAVAVTVQNLSGNKLDYYLDTALDLKGSRPLGKLGEVDASITLTNTAPKGVTSPRYIFGPGSSPTSTPAGVERALVTLYLPFGSSLVKASGDPTVEAVTSGTEAGRPYVSYIADVGAGATHRTSLNLELAPRPPGPYSLSVVPSPRVRPTSVTVALTTEAAPVGGKVVLDRTWAFLPGTKPVPVLAPIYR